MHSDTPISAPQVKPLANRSWLYPLVYLLALAAAAASVGCAHQFPEYPNKAPGDCAIHASRDGVALGVDPIFDPDTNARYFQTDMVGRGILPVYVTVQNQTSGKTLLVSGDQFFMAGTNSAGDKADVSNPTAGAVIAWTGAAAISMPALFIGMAMIADAENVKTNFLRKALQPDTVSPGGSTRGFVFFKIPPERPKQLRLRAVFQDTRQGPVEPIEIIITNPGR